MNTKLIETAKENKEFEKVLDEIGFYEQPRNTEKVDLQDMQLAESLFKLGYFA